MLGTNDRVVRGFWWSMVIAGRIEAIVDCGQHRRLQEYAECLLEPGDDAANQK